MKRLFCFCLTLMLLTTFAAAEDFFIKTYPVSDSGECIVNDVTFYTGNTHIDDNYRVFYEIFVGSFSDSNGDGIGDLRGIINRMDYLNDGDPTSGLSLGVEGLWLTPIFKSPSYHKYDVADFYTIDPDFGTMEDLKELIDLCHQRDVKIILDLPINHTSTEHNWFKTFGAAHRMQNPDNIYYDFYSYIGKDEPVPAGRSFTQLFRTDLKYESNFSDAMPEPNFDNPLVREEMLKVGKYYLELGVDGFRFDAAKYIYYGDHQKSVDFWHWYIGELKKINPKLYTVAEVWDGDGIIDQYIPATNCFNFTTSQVSGLIAETAKKGNVNALTAYTETYLDKIHALNPEAMNISFISNHDMDRASGYLTMASGYMTMAASLYLLSPGSPFLYYGEEIGLRGSRGGANSDANRRLAMLWGDGDTIQNPTETTYDEKKQTPYSVMDLQKMSTSLLTHYKQLIMIRKANPEIARGEYKALAFEDKLGGFTVTWKGNTVAVLHNTTTRDITVDLAAAGIDMTTIAAVAGVGTATLDGTQLTLSGQTSVVLR